MKIVNLRSFILVVILSFTACTNQILYQPSKVTQPIYSEYPYIEKTIKTEDGEKLSAIEFHTYKKKSKGVVLFLYGNADNANNCSFFSESTAPRGYDLFLVDYRGYGKSTGSPSTKGLSLDIQATIEYLTQHFDNIYIYGQSIGGVALLGTLDKINRSKIRAIVTEGAFLSYRQLSQDFLGVLLPWVDYDELDLYAPMASNGDTTIPLMLIHSEEDNLISYQQGVALAKHFKNATHKKITGEHLRYLLTQKHYDELFDFFEKNRAYQYEEK